MADRPAIPYEPVPKLAGVAFMVEENRMGKRWTRKLAEAGKLTSPAQRIPHYGMKRKPPEDVA